MTHHYDSPQVKEPPGTRALQQKRQTRHIMDDLNPIWDESFEFLVQSSAAVLTFTLYDWDEWGSYATRRPLTLPCTSFLCYNLEDSDESSIVRIMMSHQ